MSEEIRFTEIEAHQKFARELFNLTWSLMEKADRTREETELMVHAAHASRFHWSKIGKAEQWAVGEWQIARVYWVLGRGDSSRIHSERALQICLENGLKDFHLASAYEGLARVEKLMGRTEEFSRYLELAKNACKEIQEDDDRAIIEKDIASL